VCVVLAHLWIIVQPMSWLQQQFADGGFVGLELFFVLSGFLITALLLGEHARSGTVALGAFYWRRLLRLVPALWFALAAHLVYVRSIGYPDDVGAAHEWERLRAAGGFFMNLFALEQPDRAADLSHTWSLAFEAQFYLVWPLLVVGVLALRRRPGVLLAVNGTLLVAVSVWRLLLFEADGWEAAYLRSESHLDGLLVGSLVAIAWVQGWTPERLPRWLLWAGSAVTAGMLLVLRADQRIAYSGGTTVTLLAAALVVLVMATEARQRLGPFGRLTGLLGRYSYGIYLWHYPVMYAVTARTNGFSNLERVAITAAVTTAGVLASRHLVEQPALRLKRRARPADAAAVPARAPAPAPLSVGASAAPGAPAARPARR
jgi:peptidoglycan/LPS O-acetylase OafA/YrhL